MHERLLNLKEASDFLDIHEEELEGLVSKKVIFAYKVGGRFVRFKKEDLEKIKPTVKKTVLDKTRIFTQDYQSLKTQDKFREFIYANGIYLLVIVFGISAFLIFLFK